MKSTKIIPCNYCLLIRKIIFITFLLILILVLVRPVFADYIGPNRTVTTYTTETVEYGVWADKNDKSCNPKLGEACIQCDWEGDPFKASCAIKPPTSTYYYYSLGYTTSVVEVQTIYPPATLQGSYKTVPYKMVGVSPFPKFKSQLTNLF